VSKEALHRAIVPPVFIGTKLRSALAELAAWLDREQRSGWKVVAPIVLGNESRATLASMHPDGLVLLHRSGRAASGGTRTTTPENDTATTATTTETTNDSSAS
jgi:hypothetical protein